MSAQPSESRFDFPTIDHTKYKDFYQYLGATIIVLTLITIGAILFADIQPRINDIITGISSYLTNVYTEILSVVVTILILDRRAQNREEQRRINERNQRLKRAVGSTDNATALNALAEIKELDLLTRNDGFLQNARLQYANLAHADLRDSNLQGVDLYKANLQHAVLSDTNLEGAYLMFANLQCTNLSRANLQHADLRVANLQHASLVIANLQHVYLQGANLEGAYLMFANLKGAYLGEANLSGAHLDSTQFNEKTKLPNNKKWTSKTDMTQFTNPQHPNFWQPDWVRTGFDSQADWNNAGRPSPDSTDPNP